MACIDPHQTGSVGKGSDHLQLIKFWPSRAPGTGSAAGGGKFWLRLTVQPARSVCVCLSAFFISVCTVVLVRSVVCVKFISCNLQILKGCWSNACHVLVGSVLAGRQLTNKQPINAFAKMYSRYEARPRRHKYCLEVWTRIFTMSGCRK